jgi:hypothetical protein
MQLYTGAEPELVKRGRGRPRKPEGAAISWGLRFPLALRRAALDVAAKKEMSFAAVVREAVTQYLANEGDRAA